MNMYLKAFKIAKNAHNGQVDKAGEDYFQHVLFVANHFKEEEEKAVALLHDVVEDTEISLEDLRNAGFSDDVVSAVAVLTKQRNDSYFQYIEKVKENELARKIKLVDLKHNSDLGRLSQTTKKDYERREKYLKVMEFLKDIKQNNE